MMKEEHSFTIGDLRRIAPRAKYWIISGIVRNQGILKKFGITDNSLRLSSFLSNTAHESAGFRTMSEYGGKKYFSRMYGPNGKNPRRARRNGNTRSGDGYRYRGSGILQNTWKNNFKKLTDDLRKDLENDPDLLGGKGFVDFVKEPEKLRKDVTYAVWAACSYWKDRKLNKYCDRNDNRAVCKKINGGYNGWRDREKKRKIALRAIDNLPYMNWKDWIISWMNPSRTIRAGDNGRQVEILQQQLSKAGFTCSVDGQAGMNTKRAIEACQKKGGLDIDGVAGIQVYEYLKKVNGDG